MRAYAWGVIVVGLGLGAGAFAQESQETLKAQVVESKGAEAKPAATAGGAGFSNTVCTNGKNRRLVELQPGDAAAKSPCQVHYKKETEQPGHDQVLWTSNNDPSFCNSKASAFVEKLSSWGWSCSKM